jgi:hypothetical protein
MHRKFLFPAVAITAWAQQPSPAAAEAEAAVRGRAEQFFQLQVDKKYRQAEALVAEDTKDDYYNGSKFTFKSFNIERIELLDDNTRAKVTIKGKVTLTMPTAGPIDFDAPNTSTWKVENGQWVWYIDHKAVIESPFGALTAQKGNAPAAALPVPGKAPDIATLRDSVKIDRAAVVLTNDAPEQAVTVSNGLSGGIDLAVGLPGPGPQLGFTAEIEKKHLEAGEKTLIHFTSTNGDAGAKVVQVIVSPLGTLLDIQVTKK